MLSKKSYIIYVIHYIMIYFYCIIFYYIIYCDWHVVGPTSSNAGYWKQQLVTKWEWCCKSDKYML